MKRTYSIFVVIFCLVSGLGACRTLGPELDEK